MFQSQKEVNAIIFYKSWYLTTITSHIVALRRLWIKWSNNEWMQKDSSFLHLDLNDDGVEDDMIWYEDDISFPLEIHDIPHHFAHSAWCTITPPPTYLSANPYQPPFLAWTSGRIPTKWSLSLPPGGETVGCHMIRVLDSAGSTLMEWGRQQQQQLDIQCLNHCGDRQWKG